MPTATQDHRFLSMESPLGKDVLLIESITGNESLGNMFEYRVQAIAQNENFDLDDLIGNVVSVKLEHAALKGEPYRHFNGLVSNVDHIGYDNRDHARYELTIVPWLWLLTQRSDCRIFQNKSVPEIIETIFKEISGSKYQISLKGSYPQREYCVQYRETDFNFVQRLMQHEGIYYFWKHKDGSHEMVVCDRIDAHDFTEGFEEIRYRQQKSGIQEKFILHTWQVKRKVTPGKYSLNSFDFKSPKPSPNTKLLSRSDKKHKHRQGDHEIYDNPGDYIDRADGERLAAIRREEVQSHGNHVISLTNGRGIYCGSLFKSKELPRMDQNDEYLVTATTFEASAGNYASGSGTGEDTYECELTAIKRDCPFRPIREALATRVEGPQTAIVCGPESEEIYVDDYGRVKVQFLWDRQGNFDAGSSCWVRVSQAWAGVGFGGVNIPRIGQEVIVDYLEGDPDRPIITGRVYNASNMPHASNAGRDGKPGNTPPTSLSKASMMTSFKSNSLGGSGGYNEITMNDKGGAETLFIKAQKDEIHKVGNDREDTVGNDETRSVGNNRSREVGVNEDVSVGTNRTVTVGANHSETIGANQSVSVGNNQTEVVGAAKMVSVGAAMQTTVGGAMNETIGGAKATEVGAAHLEVVGDDRSINAGKKISLTAGDEIELSSGAGKIVIKKSGRIEITGVHVSMQSGAGIVEIDAGGIVSIKGPMVKINT